MIRTPISTQNTPSLAHKQTPVRNQLINRTSISTAQAVSRKLIQKSVKLLNAPRSKLSDRIPTNVHPPVKLFPPSERSHIPAGDHLNIPQLKAPIAPVPKLPPQQALLPQENPFDINLQLVPFQDREVEAVFKAPELDDFLFPPVLGDQITDSTLMHRYLPKPADIDRITG